MWWVVWVVLAGVVGALLFVSWWLDRDARRRGATRLGGAEIDRARWQRDWQTELEMTEVMTKGATPKSADAARDIWRGTWRNPRR